MPQTLRGCIRSREAGARWSSARSNETRCRSRYAGPCASPRGDGLAGQTCPTRAQRPHQCQHHHGGDEAQNSTTPIATTTTRSTRRSTPATNSFKQYLSFTTAMRTKPQTRPCPHRGGSTLRHSAELEHPRFQHGVHCHRNDALGREAPFQQQLGLGFSMRCWMARLSGRAPNTGSNPPWPILPRLRRTPAVPNPFWPAGFRAASAGSWRWRQCAAHPAVEHHGLVNAVQELRAEVVFSSPTPRP